MFLKRLYKQSKFWFVVVVLFALGQLFINYKNGVEFSPFYHYSMYSILFKTQQSYDVVEIFVNENKLQSKDFTANGWDNLVIPILQYQHQQEWNNNIYNTTIKRLLHTNDSSLYTNNLSKNEFDDWYKQRVISYLHLDDSARIRYQVVSYQQKNNSLIRTL